MKQNNSQDVELREETQTAVPPMCLLKGKVQIEKIKVCQKLLIVRNKIPNWNYIC